MAHDHDHHHGTGYFMEQLFTIACCGLVGGIAILLYTQGTVNLILAPRFWIPLLASGIALLALVAIRAVSVWQLAGKVGDKAHAHHHGHEHCDHDHGACGHDHHGHHHHHHEPKQEGVTQQPGLISLNLVPAGATTTAPAHTHTHDHGHDHDHSHGWVPVRYLILLIVVLFWYFIPPEGLTAQQLRLADFGEVGDYKKNDLPPLEGSFTMLQNAAYDPDARELYEGRLVTLVGQFQAQPGDDKRFGLARFKINCCAADAIPLGCLVMIHPEWKGTPLNTDALHGRWVTVQGRIIFKKLNTLREEWATAIIVEPTKEMPPEKLVVPMAEPPRNPYVQ